MFKFSTKSEQLLNTVCKELNLLSHEVIKISPIDFSITEGFRDRMKAKAERLKVNIVNARLLILCVVKKDIKNH